MHWPSFVLGMLAWIGVQFVGVMLIVLADLDWWFGKDRDDEP